MLARVELVEMLAYITDAKEKAEHRYRSKSGFNFMTLPNYNIRLYSSNIASSLLFQRGSSFFVPPVFSRNNLGLNWKYRYL